MRLAALLLAPALIAQTPVVPMETPLSTAERTEALNQLTAAKAAFLKSVEGLSAAQRAWKPAPERWSVDQCAEHITLTEALLSNLVLGKLLAEPRDPAKRADIKIPDDQLVAKLQDRSHKATAPDVLAPKAAFVNLEDLLGAYGKSHGALEEAVRASNLDWRARIQAHPVFGALDAYQWVLLAAGHTLRHVQQIDEIKNSPGFPKA